MKFRSIRSRLILWIGTLVTLILASGSFVIYHTARSTLYEEVDKNLSSIFALESLELEMKDGAVFHEWLSDLEKDEVRSQTEYTQVWNEVTGETTRSPALHGEDLPRLSVRTGTTEVVSVILPNGDRGRAMAKRVWPMKETPSMPDDLITGEADFEVFMTTVSSLPHLMVVALNTREVELTLYRLAGILLLGLVFSLLVSIVSIRLIIALSFRPLDQLQETIRGIDVNNPTDVFDLPQDLPLELEGAVSRYRDLLTRISEVRAREREFSGNVAHELRTPLAGIEATLEQAIAVEREAADYRGRIAETLTLATRMRELVNRLMWFSRLRNGSEGVAIGEVDLHMLIEARLSVLDETITARSLNIQLSFSTETSIFQSDETLVSILINNLIGNAVAHSDANSALELSTRDEEDGLYFELINDAQDFSEAELQRIFEPFYRSDRGRSADTGHSGIGLSLASEIAQLLGLRLHVRFEESRSFIVEVIFPKK